MAFRIDEQKMVDENIFNYEQRIQSPTTRFQDSTPVFSTYFHINSDETTTDTGFKDVASIIGHRSPIKYNKIEKFPLYAMDQIILQLEDSDQGLDTDYEGEATILPSTIKPLQNDYFIIPTLHDCYLFRVTNIQYDNTMPDNFYKISFKLDYLDEVKLEELGKQVDNDYICSLENIGTENNCIIEKSCFIKIQEIEAMYDDIIDTYKAMFYNERHNVFLADMGNMKTLYDPMQAVFINKHNLFNKKNDLSTLILTDQVEDPKKRLKYEKSIYRFIERRDYNLINNFKFTYIPGVTFHQSSFYRWRERRVMVIDTPEHLPIETMQIFSDDFVTEVKTNLDCASEYATLIKRFVRGEDLGIKDISLKLNEELIYLNNSLEVFFFVPIILYIIRTIINGSIKVTK